MASMKTKQNKQTKENKTNKQTRNTNKADGQVLDLKQQNAKELRKFMYKMGMTNADLAEVLDATIKTAWNIKNAKGQVSVDTAWRIHELTQGTVPWYNWVEPKTRIKSKAAIEYYSKPRMEPRQLERHRKEKQLRPE